MSFVIDVSTRTLLLTRSVERTLPPSPSFPSPRSTMDAQTTLKICAASNTAYAAQMILAPKWANDFYYKEGHKHSDNWQRWFGLGIAGMACAQALASQESTPNKAVLVATAAQSIAAPIMMLSQKDDFKPEQIAVNGAIVGALGVLALKAAKN